MFKTKQEKAIEILRESAREELKHILYQVGAIPVFGQLQSLLVVSVEEPIQADSGEKLMEKIREALLWAMMYRYLQREDLSLSLLGDVEQLLRERGLELSHLQKFLENPTVHKDFLADSSAREEHYREAWEKIKHMVYFFLCLPFLWDLI